MNYKRFPLGALWTNGYLFWDDEKRAFFVDPGGDASEVVDFLERNGLSLESVLLTHGHLDHIAGIENLVSLVGENIYIAKKDAPLLKDPPEEMQAALNMKCNGVSSFKTVDDGDRLSVGEMEIIVLATPGHTPGSVCYLVRQGDETILISGDTLFAQSVGRTDLPGGDSAMLDESLKKLSALPDGLSVLPGHGPATSIASERKHNPFWPE